MRACVRAEIAKKKDIGNSGSVVNESRAAAAAAAAATAARRELETSCGKRERVEKERERKCANLLPLSSSFESGNDQLRMKRDRQNFVGDCHR